MAYIARFALPLFMGAFLVMGFLKKVPLYESFTHGAKEGLSSTVQIFPALLGLQVAIAMFRASGALDLLSELFSPVLSFLQMPKEVFPLALLRPLSGSGSLALVTDLFETYGPDSKEGLMASVMMGSMETTFYTVAVYFGAVGIKDTRHTLPAALLADLAGVLLSVITCRWLLF